MVVSSGPGFCNALHRQFRNENQFTFFNDGVGSDAHFVLIKRLLRAHG